jgi:hypothetical protein
VCYCYFATGLNSILSMAMHGLISKKLPAGSFISLSCISNNTIQIVPIFPFKASLAQLLVFYCSMPMNKSASVHHKAPINTATFQVTFFDDFEQMYLHCRFLTVELRRAVRKNLKFRFVQDKLCFLNKLPLYNK